MLTKRQINAMINRIERGVTAVGVPGHAWLVPMKGVERHCAEIVEERERLAALVVEPVLIGKVCPTCDEDKALTTQHWHRRSSSRDGFNSQCKECKSKYDRSKMRIRR